jgi:hypothetical protein
VKSALVKIILAVVLISVGLTISSVIGGFIISSLVWWLPKIIFVGILLLTFVIWSRRKERVAEPGNKMTCYPPSCGNQVIKDVISWE